MLKKVKRETVYRFLFVNLFSTSIVFAAGEKQECQTLNSANDILKCVVGNSTSVQMQNASAEISSSAVAGASQLINPEVEIESVKNEATGFSTGVKVLHTFELGGKRKARVKVAEAGRKASQISVLKEQEAIAVQTVLDLHRLRQIETEVQVVNENLITFDRISTQYSSAGALNPEQEISLTVFKLAYEENKLKKGSLLNEKEQISSRLEQAVGKKVEIPKISLPVLKTEWPELSNKQLSGAESQILDNDLEVSKANYELEKSLGWSDLSVGPNVEFATGESSNMRYGVALSLPLPLYHTNHGGKAKALSEIRRSELGRILYKRNLEQEKELLYEVYKKSSAAIKEAISKEKIEAKHKDVHKMIKRGIVSAALVIELHRQIFEYYQTLHEQERQGVEAEWRIYALEGQILEKELK